MIRKKNHVNIIINYPHTPVFIPSKCLMPCKTFNLNLWKKQKNRKERRKQRDRKELECRKQRELEKLERYKELRRAKKEQERKIEREEKNVRFAVNIMSFGSTLLLFKGGMAMICLGTSMVSVKLVSMIGSSDKAGTGLKAFTILLFSGAAFCFKSRSMELCGGTIIFFIHIMVL
eukprot:CAMPEP_0204646036 /NCGR_PEP_ID=MMETSP0718-20130828/3955_1 /ASSEMBLY_ACC=CAM_ASM_000674 /TAXON_ID=230516 /ORGANISM="Chaetoceros curvisetus" /LENGTH=174 /DNA_ID=CAMNT_0051668167 /DNA_START=586 /DNA_END=1110 /DNA_ORIENTATION=+